MSVPTRSHSLLPCALESVSETLALPAMPIFGPLLLVSVLRVKSAVDTAAGVPKA
ncbi:hypothetical protein D3C84_1197360 [compost metagenome]